MYLTLKALAPKILYVPYRGGGGQHPPKISASASHRELNLCTNIWLYHSLKFQASPGLNLPSRWLCKNKTYISEPQKARLSFPRKCIINNMKIAKKRNCSNAIVQFCKTELHKCSIIVQKIMFAPKSAKCNFLCAKNYVTEAKLCAPFRKSFANKNPNA